MTWKIKNKKKIEKERESFERVLDFLINLTFDAYFLFEKKIFVFFHSLCFALLVFAMNDLKETVNNLNEMNRKLYEENQQYKDRNIEQRQQIEHYHVLFQENQQKNEQTMSSLRKERDEAYQRENELKRRMQQTLDAKQQDSFVVISTLKEKYDTLKQAEAHLSDELSSAKMELLKERTSADLLDKKCKILDKDNGLLKENWHTEKQQYSAKIEELESKLDKLRKENEGALSRLDEKAQIEREDLKSQLGELERKLEEIIREKAQLACKYGQMVDSSRELNSIIQSKDALYEQKVQELK